MDITYKIKNKIVGRCYLIVNEKSLYLSSLYVSPEYRGKKVGIIILRIAKRIANRKNKKLILTASPYGTIKMKRPSLTQFYMYNGFVVVGHHNTLEYVPKTSKGRMI